MKYSVLVPVYNVERYLCQCLDSLVNQTYRDFEVILADDGSTDSSGEICDRYAEQYPEMFRVFHKSNEGLLMTRRFSLRQARGERIVFVDSDDYVKTELLETVDKAFAQYNCDMVLYNFYRFQDGESEFSITEIPYKDGTVFEGENKRELCVQFALKHIFSNMWIKAVKKSIVDIETDYASWNVGRGEDIIQSFALFDQASRIAFIDKPLYYYRKNEQSVTSCVRAIDWGNYLTWSERTFMYLDIWKSEKSVHARFAVRQMSHFFYYLRDIERKAARENNENMLFTTIRRLGEDRRYKRILELYDYRLCNSRLKLRMQILRWAMMGQRWKFVCTLIRFSNRLGK